MTYKETWDGETLEQLTKSKHTNPERFMRHIFWDALEHDSDTAKKLAQESVNHFSEINRDLKAFRKAMRKLQSTLIKATKNSHKY